MIDHIRPVQNDVQTEVPDWLAPILEFLRDHQLILQLGAVVVLLMIAYLADKITKGVLLGFVRRVVKGTPYTWDDVLHKHRVFQRLAHLAPALAIYFGVQLIPDLSDGFTEVIQQAATAAMVIVAVITGSALLSAGNEIFSKSALAHGRPIKGYVQVARIVLYLIGGIIASATLTGRSPLLLLGGFSAFTAVLIIVFRDTILSFVASLQIASYDTMRVGDWIEMPQYGADGDVVDIGLHTIRVQNWDKTITSIPTHKFLTDSFKNWRSMSLSGGRRIKRAIHIDMSSVRFLDDADTERFKRFALLRDYIQQKEDELRTYNAERVGDSDLVANARRLTNIGTFRAYVVNYLREHPKLQQGMTLMVRQLEPTPEGLPLQIYAFSSDTRWVPYEGIQSDIFDHIIAIVPEFGLRVFQQPSGRDFERALGQARGG